MRTQCAIKGERIFMEREFNLNIFLKLLKKFWYVMLIAIIVAGAIGTVYATVLSKDSYAVDASVKVSIFYDNPPKDATGTTPEGNASLFTSTTAGDFSKLYNKVFDADFDKQMVAKLVELGYDVKEGDSTKSFYEIGSGAQSYDIAVTMGNRDHALALGQQFIDIVEKELSRENLEINELLNVYGYEGYAITFIDAPEVNLEKSKSAMSWYLGLAIGIVAGVAIYFVLILILYFYNPKFQSVEEFNSQYDIAVLEGDSAVNGLANTAIKVRLALADADNAKTIALNAECDANALKESLEALGTKVMVTDVKSIAQDLASVQTAVADAKAKYAQEYDYVLISASLDATAKDYLLIADSADGAILKLNMDDNAKKIKSTILELAELKNINLVGVVF